MSVTPAAVKEVAALARLSLDDDRARQFTSELNAIIEHMRVLEAVDTSAAKPLSAIGGEGRLRVDEGSSVELAAGIEAFAPAFRDGFFLVPRLSTHDSAGEG